MRADYKNTKVGDKIVFKKSTKHWFLDREENAKKLVSGQVYTVKKISVASSSTGVILEETNEEVELTWFDKLENMNTEQIEKIAINWNDIEKPEDIKWSPRYVEYKIKDLFLELLEIEKQRELTVKTGLRMRNYLEQFSNYGFSSDREKSFLDIAGCKINLELDFNTSTWGIEYNGIQLVK